jgi:predicted nuclease with RNAse H fold
MAEEQRLRCAREAVDDNLRLTWEELERLIEHFAGANDPISAAIAAKAAAALEKHEEALRESATRATP